ncbi:calphotin-like [Procambarus clarkii]|uniref:calphotin-like n=1 Tax=Procambarus clarkii TaxID=6728 RepID=UPI003744830B
MSSDRALRGVARATSGSATALPSGGDSSIDLRPVSKRSRRALSLSPPRNAAWADVGEFEDSGSSSFGDGDVCDAVGVPAAPVGRVAAVMGPVVGLSPGPGPVSSPAASASPDAGSLGWEVVAPAEIAREGRGLVPVLTTASVPAASVPLASMSVPSTPLPSAQSSFVTPSPVVSAPAPSPSVIASPCDSARSVAGLCPADSCASVPCGSTVCIKALCAASSRAYRPRGGGSRAGGSRLHASTTRVT